MGWRTVRKFVNGCSGLVIRMSYIEMASGSHHPRLGLGVAVEIGRIRLVDHCPLLPYGVLVGSLNGDAGYPEMTYNK